MCHLTRWGAFWMRGDRNMSVRVVVLSVVAMVLVASIGRESASLLAGLYHPPGYGGTELAGMARVIDGDTIALDGTRIRLWGIDAPERLQTCQGKTGEVYECGRDATAVLTELARDRRVECSEKDRDRYSRIVAVCRTASGELNASMVRRGWATDYTQYSHGRYRAEEEAARREGLGIWSGRFEQPAEWRRSHK